MFSKTTGFRHDSIGEGIQTIRELGEANGFQVDATEDATVFRDEVLAHYDVVVFMSTTGDPLNHAPAGWRSSATSVAAAATPASTRRRTPSTTGPGTASWWAATSATTRRGRRVRRS